MVQVKDKMKTQKIDLGIEQCWLPEVQLSILDLIRNFDFKDFGNGCTIDIETAGVLLEKIISSERTGLNDPILIESDRAGIIDIIRAINYLLQHYRYEDAGKRVSDTMFFVTAVLTGLLSELRTD